MKKILLGVAVILVSFTTYGQVGIGTANPEGALDIVSTNSGVVFPRVVNAAAVTTPVNGMVIYDLSLSCFNFYENGVWSGCLNSSNRGRDTTTTVVDVTNPATGKTWMDRNLGATQVATTATDVSSYGDLYQWGRAADGHQLRTSGVTATLATTSAPEHGDFLVSPDSSNDLLPPQNDNLWQGVTGTNNPCPSGYRLPTETELNNERLSWDSNNAVGALGSPLKLPITGYRSSNGTLTNVGTDGYYWSDTVSSANATLTSSLFLGNSDAGIDSNIRAVGFAVRCTKNIDNALQLTSSPVYCTGSTTAIVDVTNPATGKTWMDRNLGASQVAISVTDGASYGDLYQWGRSADGHQCRTSGTTTVLSTTTAPEHGDFIISRNGSSDWLTPQDDNLWQGIAGINNPCPSGYRLPTETELNNERLSWTYDDDVSAFESPLKLTIGGSRSSYYGDTRNGRNGSGMYWSSGTFSGTRSRMLVFNSRDSYMSYDHRAEGMSVRCTKNIDNPPPPTPVYCTGSATTIVDVTNPTTGKTWMDRNLGATQVATSSTDSDAYGDLYQWGRFTDGHQCRTSATTTVLATTTSPDHGDFILTTSEPYEWLTIPNGNLWQGVAGINNPCPVGYRIPTETELNNERLSWGSNNVAGAFGSPLKFTLAGTRFAIEVIREGTHANYWSSTYNVTSTLASYLGFDTSGNNAEVYTEAANTLNGMSVRCTKNADNPPPPPPTTPVYCTGSATTIVDVTNLATGKTWMDRNLGATQAATSFSDAASYGDLYQWGRFTDGHQCRTSGTTTDLSTTTSPDHGDFIVSPDNPYDWLTPQNGNLWQGVDGTNNPCPSGYRLPTATELENERLSWSSNDRPGAFGSPLKLTSAGLSNNGTLTNVDNLGYYWSGTVSSANATKTNSLFFSGSYSSVGDSARALGFSVRCTKNIDNPPPVYCTGSPTVIVDVTNPTTGKTWMDRNLGATQAATSSVDTASYGDLYQWGRFTDGHQCRTSGTTTVLATTSTPDHGDFIVSPSSPNDWLTPQNGNLWQGITGINNPCPYGYRIPTETELNNERLSWGSNNATGALGSPLKLSIPGVRFSSDGTLNREGTHGHYWSSTVSGTNTIGYLYVLTSDASISPVASDATGMSVRCTKNIDNAPPTPVYCTGSATAIVDVTNPATGKTWMDRNLGATQAALSSTDLDAYGDLYQWGRFTDGHQCRTSSTTANLATNSTPEHGDFILSPSSPNDWLTPQDNNLWQGVDGINNPCPSGYRIPTETELENERLSWSSNNYVGAFGSPLKFPVAGIRTHDNGTFYNVDNAGYYRSSTDNGASLTFYSNNALIANMHRAYGSSVRCTKNVDNPPPTPVYCTGSATAIVDVTNPTTGKIWMDRNLGATQAATSSSDTASYGDLYQWGRAADGHQCRTSGTTTILATNSTPEHGDFILSPSSPNDWLTPQNDNLWQGVDGINNPCPSGYRLPTETELNNERLSWGSNNAAGAFGSPLKFPLAGTRLGNGILVREGNYAYYWSGTVSSASATRTNNLFLGNSNALVSNSSRAGGMSVRCTKNIPLVYCTGGATAIVDVTNPATGKTWMDRNLGATQAALSSTDTASYGDLYQWGRLSDGHQCRTSGTTTNLATTAAPGHGDFIVSPDSPNDWLTPQSDNLWQGVAGINNPCPSGYRIPTETELNNERLSWSPNNATGAFGSPLKFPLAGTRFGDGTIVREGTHAYYWSSTVSGTSVNYLDIINNWISPVPRAGGHSVRCTKNIDNAPQPITYCTGSATTIVDVTNPTTGKIWMDRNLGATQAATSSSDTASYGDLYQWGRAADGHQCRTSGTTTVLATNSTPEHGDFILSPDSPNDWLTPQNGNLWQGVDGINNPCPAGYRIPTETELNNERLSWASSNAAGALGSPLKLPLAGERFSANGTVAKIGSDGYYWSSTFSGTNESSFLSLSTSNALISDFFSGSGMSVRCTKNIDNPPCIGNATAIVDVTNPTTGKTWMDRNLGAAQVASSSLDIASYGGLYQWGRFTDGHQCRTSGTTTVLSTTTAPEHGDFIVSPDSPKDWLTPQDGNLWQGVYGINNPCPSGYRLPTETELENERASWNYNDNRGAFASALKLPMAGFSKTNSDGTLVKSNSGYYWSSTVSGISANALFFITNYATTRYYEERGSGLSVRCTKNIDNPLLYCTGSATTTVDVTNPATGKTWMDRNLGATQAATSSTDTASYGDLYQWGRFTDGHQCRTSGTTTDLSTTTALNHGNFIVSPDNPNDWLTPQDDTLWQGITGANNPCPSGYRIPTETELNNERLSWSPNNNATGAFGSPLKLPVTGYRSSNGTLTNVGSYGYYWSDTVSSINAANTSNLFLGNSDAGIDSNSRAHGFAVRCIKNIDNPPCIGSATAIVDVTNPITGKTWMDRNLGATQAATSSTDAASYGGLYQWGRFTDGHQCKTSSATAILATNRAPNHGDFIESPSNPFDWSTSQDDTLWQGVDGTNNPCPSGYRIPTATELINERASWSSSDTAGAFDSPLKLPTGGSRIYTGQKFYNNLGYYWSDTVSSNNPITRIYLSFNTGVSGVRDGGLRASAYSVRCIKD